MSNKEFFFRANLVMAILILALAAIVNSCEVRPNKEEMLKTVDRLKEQIEQEKTKVVYREYSCSDVDTLGESYGIALANAVNDCKRNATRSDWKQQLANAYYFLDFATWKGNDGLSKRPNKKIEKIKKEIGELCKCGLIYDKKLEMFR